MNHYLILKIHLAQLSLKTLIIVNYMVWLLGSWGLSFLYHWFRHTRFMIWGKVRNGCLLYRSLGGSLIMGRFDRTLGLRSRKRIIVGGNLLFITHVRCYYVICEGPGVGNLFFWRWRRLVVSKILSTLIELR